MTLLSVSSTAASTSLTFLSVPFTAARTSSTSLNLSVCPTAASTTLNGTGDKSSLDAANSGFYIYGSNTSTEFVVDGGGAEVPLTAAVFFLFFFFFHVLFSFSSYSYSLQR